MSHRLSTSVSTPNLLGLCVGELTLARKHIARLPGGESTITRVSEHATALESRELAWAAKVNEEDAALDARDLRFGELLPVYDEVRGWADVAARSEKGGEKLLPLLQSCLSPSLLTPANGVVCAEELAAGAEAHPELFAPYKVDAVVIADLRDRAKALRAAVDNLAMIDGERSAASKRREVARSDLVAELRKLERYFRRILPPDERANLSTLRAHYLPRNAPAAKASG